MNLADWLKQSGIKKADFAGLIGCTPGRVSQLVSGEAWPSRDLAQRIAQATGGAVTANDFAASGAACPREDAGLAGRRVLLVIGGGIAAYKCLDLIRRLRERGAAVRVVMTKAAEEFVTPLSIGALAGESPFTDLFDAKSEFDVGHIRLAREADLVAVAPATADLMARMAAGHAGDLATAILLATGAPVLVAPAMNPYMWRAAATQRNLARLVEDGVQVVGPNTGEMAEAGESGPGRMAEPMEIVAALERLGDAPGDKPLAGVRVLVTSGPTHEPIDPVRYIANRSSGRQGHAIAAAAARLGAEVTLVSGPVRLADPQGVSVVHVETAQEMLEAVQAALPADIGVFAAAVADWRMPSTAPEKLKKTGPAQELTLELVQNPDILKTVGLGERRPELVIGFAAETENVVVFARQKRFAKGCDWIVANDVSPETGVMGGERNLVHLVTEDRVEDWPELAKEDVADRLMRRAAEEIRLRRAEEAR